MVMIQPKFQRMTYKKLAGLVLGLAGAFLLDVKYFSMCQGEMDTFMEKSRLWGNWRERNARKPVTDTETMKE